MASLKHTICSLLPVFLALTLTGCEKPTNLRIDGSSTVFPVSMAVAEEFAKQSPAVRVTVGYSGTGGGMKQFAAGELEICDASRAMKNTPKPAAGHGWRK